MLMTRMGYQVKGVDLAVFAEKPAVARRAAEHGIPNHGYILGVLGKPVGIPYDNDTADMVVCTEMLEHITFNPIKFWSEVYRVIRSGGVIILTTPNSLSLINTLAQLKRLLLRKSVGIEVRAILSSISSGHHWKEYSLGEIREYFGRISPDFQVVKAEYYGYRDSVALKKLHRIIYWLQESAMPKSFRSELLAVVKVQKNRGVQITDPDVEFL
jgi:2-polyprenyl-6-hydroxyphenyl methylase/3-demethylubiquinone-9 3-methyltransferase